jgi:hypothetical protein
VSKKNEDIQKQRLSEVKRVSADCPCVRRREAVIIVKFVILSRRWRACCPPFKMPVLEERPAAKEINLHRRVPVILSAVVSDTPQSPSSR